jgi:hypothetical protein
MNECPECGTNDSMYRSRDGKKCFKCGFKPDYDNTIIDNHPTRESDADCGDIISNKFEGVSRAAVREAMCVDGTMCSVSPSTIKKDGDRHTVVCYHHRE